MEITKVIKPCIRRGANTFGNIVYLATGKMQLCSSDDLGLLQHLLRRCSFPIKYVKYDSMVKKKKNIYTYIVVCEREREREERRERERERVRFKKGNITPVISK